MSHPDLDHDEDVNFVPKLGWKPGPSDPRTLRLENYTTPDLPAPPERVDWMGKVDRWPLLGNDRMGNCVWVSTAHLVQGWTTYASGTPILIPERDVVDAYSRVTGYDPATGANDNGTRSLDALNYWRKTGVGGRRIVAYVKVDHRNDDQIKAAINLFGGIYIAAQLPLAAQAQFRARKTWTPTSGRNGRRGSWGGHAMHLGQYGKTGVVVSTWGRTQRASWSWWDSYISEAFAVVSTDWLDRLGGRSPQGLDLDQLLADLRKVAS